MEESYLRKLISNLEKQNILLMTRYSKLRARYLKLEDKVYLLKDSEDKNIDNKTLKQFNKMDSQFKELDKIDSQLRFLHQTHISNFETINILEDKLQEILLEEKEKEFYFGIGNEVTIDTEQTSKKERNLFLTLFYVFIISLFPIAMILVIAQSIKDFLS